jgi:hypothetical protein
MIVAIILTQRSIEDLCPSYKRNADDFEENAKIGVDDLCAGSGRGIIILSVSPDAAYQSLVNECYD